MSDRSATSIRAISVWVKRRSVRRSSADFAMLSDDDLIIASNGADVHVTRIGSPWMFGVTRPRAGRWLVPAHSPLVALAARRVPRTAGVRPSLLRRSGAAPVPRGLPRMVSIVPRRWASTAWSPVLVEDRAGVNASAAVVRAASCEQLRRYGTVGHKGNWRGQGSRRGRTPIPTDERPAYRLAFRCGCRWSVAVIVQRLLPRRLRHGIVMKRGIAAALLVGVCWTSCRANRRQGVRSRSPGGHHSRVPAARLDTERATTCRTSRATPSCCGRCSIDAG